MRNSPASNSDNSNDKAADVSLSTTTTNPTTAGDEDGFSSVLADVEQFLDNDDDDNDDDLVIDGFAIDEEDEDSVSHQEQAAVVIVKEKDNTSPSLSTTIPVVSRNGNNHNNNAMRRQQDGITETSSLATTTNAASKVSMNDIDSNSTHKSRILTPLDPVFDNLFTATTTSSTTPPTALTNHKSNNNESIPSTNTSGTSTSTRSNFVDNFRSSSSVNAAASGLFTRAAAAAAAFQKLNSSDLLNNNATTPTATTTTTTAITSPRSKSQHQNKQQQQALKQNHNQVGGATVVKIPSPSPATTASSSSPSAIINNDLSTPADSSISNSEAQQSQLIRYAFGGSLLPGEKVIMFLSHVTHVADSSSTVSGVASSSSSTSSLMTNSSNRVDCISDVHHQQKQMEVWCCVMTFYRVALFNYIPCEDLPHDAATSSTTTTTTANIGPAVELDDDANGNEKQGTGEDEEEKEELQDETKGPYNYHNFEGENFDKNKTTPSHSTRRSRKGRRSGIISGIETAIDRGALSRQWQACHSVAADEEEGGGIGKGITGRKRIQHILQMPLGCIDRVEKGSDSSLSSVANSSIIGPLHGTVNMHSSFSGGGSSSGGGAKLLTGISSSSLSSASFGGGGSGNGSNHGGGGSGGNHHNLTLVLFSRDGRWMRFTTQSLGDCIRAHEALSTYAFPGRRNLGYLFAFESCREEIMSGQMRGIDNRRFLPMREYARMGIDTTLNPGPGNSISNRPWTMTKANAEYRIIPSYPAYIVVPNQAAEERCGAKGLRLLKQTAAFRSEGRAAAFCWGSPNDAASLWRCSQPKVGISSNRSAADEIYIQCIAEAALPYRNTNKMIIPPAYSRMLSGAADAESDSLSFLQMVDGSGAGNGQGGIGAGVSAMLSSATSTSSNSTPVKPTPPLKIVDLRPKSSAIANRTAGYGYESTSNYPNCTISFWNIGNIHVVRDSCQKLQALAQSPVTNDVQWSSLVESTQWLFNLRTILNASWNCAATVHFHRLPVLIHCSHGWDRTSQVSAIAQLFLDAYYRTIDGFAVLVEKEFCSFGHPFHTRAGHGESGRGSDNGSQRAPIFLQFLDCVWQLVNLFPIFFEFNGRYLHAIADHIYSCRFGTLLCDNERERTAAAIHERTRSLWDYLDEYKDGLFVNSMFNRVSDVFLPPLPTILRRVSFWTDYHLIHSPKACTPCLARELAAKVYSYSGNIFDEIDSECAGDNDGAAKLMNGDSSHPWHGSTKSVPPPELKSLHCLRDEGDAAINAALSNASEWREKAEAKQREIDRLNQLVIDLGGAAVGEDTSKKGKR